MALFSQSSVGGDLDCANPSVNINLNVELPFNIMVDDGPIQVPYEGHIYPLSVSNSCYEVYVGDASHSKTGVVYVGPEPTKAPILKSFGALALPSVQRRTRTMLSLPAKCTQDALDHLKSRIGVRAEHGHSYFVTLCAAHIPVINELLLAYHSASSDASAMTVARWDVPVWVIQEATQPMPLPISLTQQGFSEHRPLVNGHPMVLATAAEVDDALVNPLSAAEIAMLDASSLERRGDYVGALKMCVTSVEVLLENRYKAQLLKTMNEEAAEKILKGTRSDFKKRAADYREVTGLQYSLTITDQFDDVVRQRRHRVVHDGLKLTYEDRGEINNLISFARAAFDAIESDRAACERRNRNFAIRAIGGMEIDIFRPKYTPQGVTVFHPKILWQK